MTILQNFEIPKFNACMAVFSSHIDMLRQTLNFSILHHFQQNSHSTTHIQNSTAVKFRVQSHVAMNTTRSHLITSP
jgi:hypothetical protein